MPVVFPVHSHLRGSLLSYPRLYAYPAEPEPPGDRFTILDSGAYSLSQRGQSMTPGYMQQLAEHYHTHGAGNVFPVLAIAPDVFLNPTQTMKNWSWWQENINQPVVPVLQARKKGVLAGTGLLQQARFYARWRPPVVAISNPGMRALQVDGFGLVLKMIRNLTSCHWLHNLGAGWDVDDARRWLVMGFNSVDSIAYYTDAQSGKAWRTTGGTEPSASSFVDLALWNAAAVRNL